MSDDSREYGLVRSFGIDNGELDGLQPSEIFVLGYELAMIDEELKSGCGIARPVHANNKDRIESELIKQGREYELTWCANDPSENWMSLVVHPLEATQ